MIADTLPGRDTRAGDPLDRLNAQLARMRATQPLWTDLPAEPLSSLADLARLPVLRKSDLAQMQAKAAPFGGLTGGPVAGLRRLFVSPGPIFDPEGRGADWWGSAAALSAAGVTPGDVILNTFSYHLTPAAFIFEAGAETLGCPVIPAGPGNTADQLTAITQYRPRVYVGVPDFLKIILDKADEDGVDRSCLRVGMVTGAALPDSLRADLAGRGVAVRQCYGTADLGIVAYEDGGPGMAVNDGVIVEIVRPGTGDPVSDGEVGEIVVTRLNADYPLLRFATGDMSATDGAGRIKGWMGRADQAAKVKGMFVRPEQIAAIGRAVPGCQRLRLEITRAGEQDRMRLLAEHPDSAAADRLAEKLAEITRLKGSVQVVAPGSLPNDGRVIADLR
ncbi:phenylacetate--CoA ligase family protein [Paracoccus sediminis]|uniref:Phenylacetate--CoA ligase family protein n=1 Tax=Paracoccus sediminis TaxID=1214787 RepID=A0A238VER9_9RHOB|nr:AMP-binding protein [Paracoccus sediminis]TBN52006.1 phenylacetate--CoA ligase family protein [Paracoccus sediminis]SNR32895.1 phenylacetate-CoA ligase [Paracoccus sediminis]